MAALLATRDLRGLDPATLRDHPEALATLRMSTAPPLAVDRLIGLAGANKNLVRRMEQGEFPPRMGHEDLDRELAGLCRVLTKLLDHDIFPWLKAKTSPTAHERDRASTIVADRLCNAVANPIIRNAQEKRQLEMIGRFLGKLGYRRKAHPVDTPVTEMAAGTYAFHMNLPVGPSFDVNLPVDVVIQPHAVSRDGLPLLIEAKSAGDFTNTNKRRKEEATKVRQLRETYGSSIRFILFLCGYFDSGYLGYEAAEGIDWVWEHRIEDLLELGLEKR